MFSDYLPQIIIWWSILFGIGIVFFPLTWLIFKRTYGLGYAISKIFGLIVLSYITFLITIFSSNLLRFNTTNIIIYFAVFLLINLFIFIRNKNSIQKDIRGNIVRLFLQETIFTAGLFLWSYVRAHQPEIRGLEKFMDYGFINAILRSEQLPPPDMWASGSTINYYWFGHFVTALLTKLSQIPSEITYNLMIATILGMTLVIAFVISATLIESTSKKTKKKYIFFAGIISAIILTFAGNFHTPFYILKNGSSNYWYPDATRFIGYNPDTDDKTIHEFPIYSFVVADLHGHLLNLPFVLLFIISALVFVNEKSRGRYKLKLTVLLGLILGVMFMTSTWDFGNYLLTLGIILLFSSLKDNEFRIIDSVIEIFTPLTLTLVFGILFALPFILNFQSIAEGIKFVHTHTPIWQLAILWGFTIVVTFVMVNISRKVRGKITRSDIFVWALITSSWILIILPEIIYLKDIYASTHYRANTMFKLTYQAFVMTYLAGGYVIVRQISLEKHSYLRKFLVILWIVILYPILSYAKISVDSYYQKLQNYSGLDGTKWLQTAYPDEYEVVGWLKANAEKEAVLLEAPGDSYTDYNFISSYTGIPTVSGWFVHEWLWRGTPNFPQARVNDIENIYLSENINIAQALLKKYDVKYIIVGSFERQKYPQLVEYKFNEIATPVFQSGVTTVYRVN